MLLTSGALASPGRGSCMNRSQAVSAVLRGTLTILALGLMTQGLLVSTALSQNSVWVVADSDSTDTGSVSYDLEVHSTSRDSLMVEIRRYSRMVADLRDSLSGDGDIELSETQRQLIEDNIAEISDVIEHIGVELSQLEFAIKDNTISLVNESGEGIIINIPENLDEHLSEGLEILSQVILSELPDSVNFDQTHSWDWTSFAPRSQKAPRKIVRGNIIKVWDDLHVPATEDVRGNVVVVFGNAEVSGRVDGDVVAVFGNLLLDCSSEITGQVVSVGGRLDQDPEAEVGDVVAVDLWPRSFGGGPAGILGEGIQPFLMCQGTFLLTLLLAIIAVIAVPRVRFQNVTDTLRFSFGPSLGLGLVVAIVGLMVVAVLMAVLILTVIGIPLALLVFLAVVILVIISVAVCGAALGQRICRLLGSGCSTPWLTVVVGMTVLHLVSFLGSVLSMSSDLESMANVLVVLGVSIKTLAFLLGLGAMVNSRFGSKSPVERSLAAE